MADPLVPDVPPQRLAVTVMTAAAGPTLCPFFGKCEALLLVEGPGGPTRYVANEARTAAALCRLVVRLRVGGLVCGFIPEPARRRLTSAGVDVRLGTPTLSVDALIACFCELPHA
ncbi:hypothetical protein N1F89_04945 [Aquibium sp. A9E412]|uniref:hypothetical protein n=1 Tax=Aquibium sp. A9E412 TaxID=2976767 RepID=UPI0025B15526|nr:hypothetical protein [Aquibium sp. A9E412]MDN2565560.1 hypothetical protein [Aquibium sp. A9E412]